LPLLGRAAFEFADLAAEVLVKLLLAPEARAHQRVGAIGVGDTFGEPQRASVHLARVVKGLKGGGADALDVPRVEKFVRGDVLQVRRGRCVDRGAIGVLHATAGAVSGFPRVEMKV